MHLLRYWREESREGEGEGEGEEGNIVELEPGEDMAHDKSTLHTDYTVTAV